MKIDLLSIKDSFEKGLKTKLNLNGVQKEVDTYQIPIDYLFYNDLNGRISTYIQKYESDDRKEPLSKVLERSKDEYNDIIAKFIKDSTGDNYKSHNKTKEDIKNKGQQLAGVVLSDGRIINGNRRFTCIRELYKENGNPTYFEAAILPTPSDDNDIKWKEIKRLELNVQYNVDEKRDYSPIDRYQSFYQDTMKESPRKLDEKDYCYNCGINSTEYHKNELIVNIMLDYLNWLDKPEAFYILKDKKLDGPIEELPRLKKKMSDEERNENKEYFFSFITFSTQEKTKAVRKLVDSYKKSGQLFEKVKEKIDSNYNDIDKYLTNIQNVEKRNNLSDETINISAAIDNSFTEGEKLQALCEYDNYNKITKLCDEIIKQIENIQRIETDDLSEEELKEIKNKLSEINALIHETEDKIK